MMLRKGSISHNRHWELHQECPCVRWQCDEPEVVPLNKGFGRPKVPTSCYRPSPWAAMWAPTVVRSGLASLVRILVWTGMLVWTKMWSHQPVSLRQNPTSVTAYQWRAYELVTDDRHLWRAARFAIIGGASGHGPSQVSPHLWRAGRRSRHRWGSDGFSSKPVTGIPSPVTGHGILSRHRWWFATCDGFFYGPSQVGQYLWRATQLKPCPSKVWPTPLTGFFNLTHLRCVGFIKNPKPPTAFHPDQFTVHKSVGRARGAIFC